MKTSIIFLGVTSFLRLESHESSDSTVFVTVYLDWNTRLGYLFLERRLGCTTLRLSCFFLCLFVGLFVCLSSCVPVSQDIFGGASHTYATARLIESSPILGLRYGYGYRYSFG